MPVSKSRSTPASSENIGNVETAMKLLGADRIDHGYTIIDSPELVEEAKAANMHFAVVPTNSYYLRTLSDEEWAIKHPVRKMVELGLKVFPNSDDPTMLHISISESCFLCTTGSTSHCLSCARCWKTALRPLGSATSKKPLGKKNGSKNLIA